MARAKSLDRVTNSSQNGEAKKPLLESDISNSELEYWKKKALDLESKQSLSSYPQISPNDMIEVVSLCNDKLNLNTKEHGQGNRYSFDYFGETKNIMFSEIAQIKETQRNFARKGYFFVNNAPAVRLLGMEEDYKKILNQEKIKEILANSPNSDSLLKSANVGQQGIIANMLISMLIEGQNVDMNLVHRVSEISGIDINQRVMAQKESLERNKLEN
jgi:hypothetical protein